MARKKKAPEIKQTFCLDNREDDSVLHVTHLPDGVHGALIESIVDDIEKRIRDANGGDAEKLICGGCTMSTIENIFREVLRRGDATVRQAGGWSRTLRTVFEKMENAALYGGIEHGRDAKLSVLMKQ